MRERIGLRSALFGLRPDLKKVGALVLSAVLAGCAVGPNYVPPKVTAPSTFADADSRYFSNETGVPEFWKTFDDATLNALVSDALTANHDLRIALANLAAARAVHRESRFDLAPTVTAGGGYTKQHLSVAQAAGFPQDQEIYDAGFDAVWELDLFGRVRRGVEANRANAQAAVSSVRDAQVSVIGEVIRTYFELRGQQLQLDVIHRNIDNQAETLRLTNALYSAGRGTEFDTARAQAQLSATKAGVAPLEAALKRSIHRLSVLTGREPTALVGRLTPVRDLPGVPALVPVGDPATLLRRRPDIRVAERELAASTARIGVAVGDLFPRVTFVGNIGYAAGSSRGLGDTGSETHLIAPGISWAAFDLGRVRARIGEARAQSDASLAHYEQTVLHALEETENALAEHAASRDRLTQILDAAQASRTAAGLARTRYEHGISDFLQVLDAERTLLDVEDRYAVSRTEAATSMVAVYKALGGGWELSPLAR